MKNKTLFEGIKCITRKYTLVVLLAGAVLINVLFYLGESLLMQQGYEMGLMHHQIILLGVSILGVLAVTVFFLFNLNAIRDEMVENLQKLIGIIREQTPQDFSKKIELEGVGCDDEVYEIVTVLNKRSQQIRQYIDHLKYVIGYIQHEFNTPLATLSLSIERLQKKHPDDPEIASLEEEVDQLSRIMKSLGYLGSQNREDIPHSQILLLDAINNTVDLLKHTYSGFAVNYYGDALMHVDTNAIYIHIILKNLLENAMKYSNDTKKIDITLDDDAGTVTIQDYGKGMSPEELKNINLPFWQGDQSRGKDHGFGLGLTLVYELAELLDIRLAVQSEQNIGTSITLYFTSSADA